MSDQNSQTLTSGQRVRMAQYSERETQARYFGGCWYVVRLNEFPATNFSRVPRTMQGSEIQVGIRQGCDDRAGFTTRRYRRPDRQPVREYVI